MRENDYAPKVVFWGTPLFEEYLELLNEKRAEPTKNDALLLIISPDVCHQFRAVRDWFSRFPHFPGNLFYAHLCSGKRWDWSSNRGLSRFTTLHLTPNGPFLTLFSQCNVFVREGKNAEKCVSLATLTYLWDCFPLLRQEV